MGTPPAEELPAGSRYAWLSSYHVALPLLPPGAAAWTVTHQTEREVVLRARQKTEHFWRDVQFSLAISRADPKDVKAFIDNDIDAYRYWGENHHFRWAGSDWQRFDFRINTGGVAGILALLYSGPKGGLVVTAELLNTRPPPALRQYLVYMAEDLSPFEGLLQLFEPVGDPESISFDMLQAGDNEGAAALAGALARMRPNEDAPFFLRGMALLRLGRHAEAREAFAAAIALKGTSGNVEPEVFLRHMDHLNVRNPLYIGWALAEASAGDPSQAYLTLNRIPLANEELKAARAWALRRAREAGIKGRHLDFWPIKLRTMWQLVTNEESTVAYGTPQINWIGASMSASMEAMYALEREGKGPIAVEDLEALECLDRPYGGALRPTEERLAMTTRALQDCVQRLLASPDL